MHSSDYATPSQAMAAARTIPLDLIEGFSGAEKVPDRISTKNTFKLKLYDNLLANRKAFEVWDATLRADIGPYSIFLTDTEPTLEQWCQSKNMSEPSSTLHGADFVAYILCYSLDYSFYDTLSSLRDSKK